MLEEHGEASPYSIRMIELCTSRKLANLLIKSHFGVIKANLSQIQQPAKMSTVTAAYLPFFLTLHFWQLLAETLLFLSVPSK